MRTQGEQFKPLAFRDPRLPDPDTAVDPGAEGTAIPQQLNPFEYDEPIQVAGRLFGRDDHKEALNDAWAGTHHQVVEITAPILCGSSSLFLSVARRYESGGLPQMLDVAVAAHVGRDLTTSATWRA